MSQTATAAPTMPESDIVIAGPSSMQIDTLRQTELGAILACGHKFYLERVLGFKWAGSRKTFLGTAFHRAMENIYRAEMVGDRTDWDEASQWANESLETALTLASDETLMLEEDESVEGLVEKGKETLALAIDWHRANIYPGIIAKGRPLAVEETVSFEYRGLTITGTVDLLDADGVLHDWKVTSAYLAKGMPWNYWMQLARYAWFWNYAMGLPISGVSLDMISTAKMKNKAVDKRVIEGVSFPGTDMDRMIRIGKESVDQAIDQLKIGYFPRNAINSFSGLCDFCDHRGDRCLNTNS